MGVYFKLELNDSVRCFAYDAHYFLIYIMILFFFSNIVIFLDCSILNLFRMFASKNFALPFKFFFLCNYLLCLDNITV